MPDERTLTELAEIMENFVTRGFFSITKKRLYAKPEDGGLGLFDLKIFLIGLQSTWVKRAFQCCNDNWKFDLICGYDNDFHKIGLKNSNIGTTLIGIAKSFRTFAEVFAKVGSNYLHVPILNNNLFDYGNRGGLSFDKKFFEHWADTPTVAQLTWEQLTENVNFKDFNAVRDILGVSLTHKQFQNLKIGWNRAKKKFHVNGKNGSTLNDFLMLDRKGSKRFREILTKNSRMEQGKNLKNLQQVKTYARLTGSANTEISCLKSMMGAWNNNFLPGKIRIFFFKFYNNILGLNTRVAKFNRETDPSCTFCSISNLRHAEQEVFAHVFYFCETTNKLLTDF